MSIYTEEAERRFKTACRECGELGIGNFHKCASAGGTFKQERIVAECWTCINHAEYPDAYIRPLTVEKTAEHRAAGHDVRERKS